MTEVCLAGSTENASGQENAAARTDFWDLGVRKDAVLWIVSTEGDALDLMLVGVYRDILDKDARLVSLSSGAWLIKCDDKLSINF